MKIHTAPPFLARNPGFKRPFRGVVGNGQRLLVDVVAL